MKKISVLLALVMLVCSLSVAAFAADGAVATITNATAAAGGEVTLTVAIKNAPAIVGAQFVINYDSSVMSYVSAKGADSSFFTSASPEAGANPVKITMANLSLTEKSGDITAATVTFKMAADVKDGNYNVGLSVTEAYNAKIEPVSITATNGFVTVGDYVAPPTEIKMTIDSLTAFVNGESKTLDAAPIIRNSRTMLPVRFVAENLGATVGWDDATKTVSVKSADTTIEIVIGAATAKVNGAEIALDSPAFIENSRTYLPVRVVAENLGATVSWDDATKTATLVK